MDAATNPALPWDALRNTEDPITWPALRRFSQALAMTPAFLPKLLEAMHEHAGFAAHGLLTYAWNYEGRGPEQLSEPVLRAMRIKLRSQRRAGPRRLHGRRSRTHPGCAVVLIHS